MIRESTGGFHTRIGIVSLLIHGQKLFAAFIPAGTPLALVPLMILLEILAYLTRTLSLGLRLAVNMTTGHILAKVMMGFIWAIALSANFISTILFAVAMSLITLFIGLEILIAYLQATIFVFITCITIKDMTTLIFKLGSAPIRSDLIPLIG